MARIVLTGMVLFVGLALELGVVPAARAGETEVRDFATKIDGKPAGEYHLTIQQQDDGSVAVTGQAEIKVTKLGITTYHYNYRGAEVWKNSRLVSFQSQADDNGTKYKVSATAERAGLRLRVNDAERIVRPDVWITSYWQLPEARRRNGSLPLLDADSGRTLTGALRLMGTESITIAGKAVNCHHYRITGPLMVDAWYDGQDRLVRQEWTESGHTVVMELTSLRR
jgi:hypothetical protein